MRPRRVGPAVLLRLVLAMFAVCAACSSRRRTAVRVVLESTGPFDSSDDYEVFAWVRGGDSGRADPVRQPPDLTFRRGGMGAGCAAIDSFMVTPPSDAAADARATVQIRVIRRLTNGGVRSFVRSLSFGFIAGETRMLRLVLDAQCGVGAEGCTTPGVPCVVAQRCEEQGLACGAAGMCVPAFVDRLERDDPSVGRVDGACVDAGITGPFDSGDPDARSDAASDAPSDGAPADVTCFAPNVACAGRCVDVSSSMDHCGGCNRVCGARGMCVSGRCECATGAAVCGTGTCIDLLTDPRFCGGCFNRCPTGARCMNGGCLACPIGTRLCSGACVVVENDERHCGACDRPCATGATCVLGACQCPMGQLACGGACVTPATDPRHCGRCGQDCGAGDCVGGACVCRVGGGVAMCAGRCANTLTDAQHCGACGRACPRGAACVGGACRCSFVQNDDQLGCQLFCACNDNPNALCCVNGCTSRDHCWVCGNACGTTGPGCAVCEGQSCRTRPMCN